MRTPPPIGGWKEESLRCLLNLHSLVLIAALEYDRDAEFKAGNISDPMVAQLAVPEPEPHYAEFRFY